ncbi:MAG: UDP-N-acetylglucosamine 1-carboxyvinyltransferase [Candidatus Nealsonbacteria bacterium]
MQDKFLIKGGVNLAGEVEISGYKNSAGACLSAVLLSKEPSIIDNLPLVSDVADQIKILERMGAKVEWINQRKVKIDPENIDPEKIPLDLFEKMRVSVLLIGPLLARFKKIKVPHPGGDKIGLRPISTHIEALKEFGVRVEEKDGFYHFEVPDNLEGQKIVLKEFSVTATEILMMFAASIRGETKIELAAAEPQVQDLGILLNKMGAQVEGIGNHTITITGVEKLNGAEFKICPDLLEAGTFMIAFALTNGIGRIKNINSRHMSLFLKIMKIIGVNFKIVENDSGSEDILMEPSNKFSPAIVQVLPYPGFPTDLQPQTSVLLTQAEGKSLIHDPLYENRFQHLHELRKLGADIEITDPHRALIFGKKELIGNKINTSDIRSGAALILAALAAKGESIIENISQIERGHENIELKLKKLGAQIEKI